jgi:hypothetical protein
MSSVPHDSLVSIDLSLRLFMQSLLAMLPLETSLLDQLAQFCNHCRMALRSCPGTPVALPWPYYDNPMLGLQKPDRNR